MGCGARCFLFACVVIVIMISVVGRISSHRSIVFASHKYTPLRVLRNVATKRNMLLSDDGKIVPQNRRRIVNRKIVLNNEEEKLFTLLKNVGDMGDHKTVVRVAGGWVRDRLLGLSGKRDIDIVLDNLTGIKFAHKLNAYCRKKNLRTYSIGHIQPNPEKSKHLETTTCKIGSYHVDFVNLRTETYADVETIGDVVSLTGDHQNNPNGIHHEKPSRIPDVQFGTPTEDALRRDLTINSLFYNLHTGELEDCTGYGIKDLDSGLVRTPFDALTTFKDDPLRILRLIRFACRYNLTIVNDVVKVLSLTCKNIDTSPGSLSMIPVLNAKIARERISDELDKMLSFDGYYDGKFDKDSGKKAANSSRERAISLLHSFNLLKRAIFVIPRETVHVPTSKALYSFLDATSGSVSSKKRHRSSEGRPLKCSRGAGAGAGAYIETTAPSSSPSSSQQPLYTVLNAQNCNEFDSFVDYGVSLMYLLRTLELYMHDHSNQLLDTIQGCPTTNTITDTATTTTAVSPSQQQLHNDDAPSFDGSGGAFYKEEAKFLRYGALAWWARDKCLMTAIESSSSAGKSKHPRIVSMTDYIFGHVLKLSNKDCTNIQSIQTSAGKFKDILHRVMEQQQQQQQQCSSTGSATFSSASLAELVLRSELGALIRENGNVDHVRYALMLAASDLLLNEIIRDNSHLLAIPGGGGNNMKNTIGCDDNGSGSGSSGGNDIVSGSVVTTTTAGASLTAPVSDAVRIDTIPPFPYANLVTTLERAFSGVHSSSVDPDGVTDNTDASWQVKNDRLFSLTSPIGNSSTGNSATTDVSNITISESTYARVVQTLSALISHMSCLGLSLSSNDELAAVIRLKPHYNGNVIKTLFANIGGGANIGALINAQMAWQLEHPAGTAEECLAYLRETYAEYC